MGRANAGGAVPTAAQRLIRDRKVRGDQGPPSALFLRGPAMLGAGLDRVIIMFKM